MSGEEAPPTPVLAGQRPVNRRAYLAFCLLLLGLVWLAYHASLKHGPRADQWILLLDTIDHHDFGDLLAHSYSYSRTRVVHAGDTQLFRPVFFTVLAAERALFGTDFRLWQAAGVMLHFTAACLLLLVMLRVFALAGPAPDGGEQNRRWSWAWPPLQLLPYALTLFFALNPAVAEQVIWFNINGYIFFVILVLGSMLVLLKVVASPAAAGKRQAAWLAGAWLLTLVAAFTYEVGQFYAVLAGLVLAAVHLGRGQARRGAALLGAFLAVALLYQTVNHLDRWHHQGSYTDDVALADITDRVVSPMTVNHAARYAVFALVQPFLPFHCKAPVIPIGKSQYRELLWNGELPLDALLVFSLVVFALWLGLTLIGAAGLAAQRRWQLLGAVVLALGTAGIHMGVIVLGRMNLRPVPDYLHLNHYWLYLTLLFILLGSTALLAPLRALRPAPLLGLVQCGAALLAVGLLALGVYGCAETHRINADAARLYKLQRRVNESLRAFVEEHRHEPDFSFAFLPHPGDNVPSVTGVPCPLILHRRYVDSAGPKYIVWFSNFKAAAAPAQEWRRSHPGEEDLLCPDLVRVGPRFHIWRHRDWYYALPYPAIAFIYSRDRHNFPGALKDRTFEGVLRQVEMIGKP